MAQPRRDFPPGKALYMGGRRDLSPCRRANAPGKAAGGGIEEKRFQPPPPALVPKGPDSQAGMLSGDNAFRESLCERSLSRPSGTSSCCGTQNSLLACAHRILTTATPFCSLFPPPAALANVPLSTREPWTYGAKNSRRRSRFAARRIAGTSNRSRQPTGDSRPPSPGERSRKGIPLPGFRRKPERIRIIFPGGVYGGKNSYHGAKCGCKAAFGRSCSRTRAQCYAIVSASFGC